MTPAGQLVGEGPPSLLFSLHEMVSAPPSPVYPGFLLQANEGVFGTHPCLSLCLFIWAASISALWASQGWSVSLLFLS